MPAEAPATACCQRGRETSSVDRDGEVGANEREEDDGVYDVEFRWRNKSVTVSLEPNQAAQPPVSLMSVPNWPFQNPRMPWCRKTSLMTDSGV